MLSVGMLATVMESLPVDVSPDPVLVTTMLKLSLPRVELESVKLAKPALTASNVPLNVKDVVFEPEILSPEGPVAFNKPFLSLMMTVIVEFPAKSSLMERPWRVVVLLMAMN